MTMSDASEQEVDLGYECHDCGEVYAPGANTSACVDQGHYVGPLASCALPVAKPSIPSTPSIKE